jgi:hypothetical protein
VNCSLRLSFLGVDVDTMLLAFVILRLTCIDIGLDYIIATVENLHRNAKGQVMKPAGESPGIHGF